MCLGEGHRSQSSDVQGLTPIIPTPGVLKVLGQSRPRPSTSETQTPEKLKNGKNYVIGRKPKTQAEKTASGNPGKQAKKTNQPKAPKGELCCPAYFGDEEREIWEETLGNAPFDVIRPADIEVLIAFCEQTSMKRQAMRELKQTAEDNRKENGNTTVMSVETERGWVKNPLVTVIDCTTKAIRSLGSELGLSPISRERLSGEREPEKSLAELLSEPRDTTKAKPN